MLRSIDRRVQPLADSRATAQVTRGIGMLLIALLLFGTLAFASVQQAGSGQAAARVTVANEFGKAQADVKYSTKITVSGKGFQSIARGFGGLYVFFGWVSDGKWQPSQGGTVGNGDYLYVPDSESKDNAGYQRFVSYPGSDTAYAANGGVINKDGAWSTTMYIPGPTFQAVGRDGATQTVDCRKVQCGIITVGAHGVANAKNETFTPVTFASLYDTAPAATSSSTTGGSTPTANPSGSATPNAGATTPAPVATTSGPAVAKVDATTAVVGRVLAFSGTGFVEGEQVVVVLDDGVAAVGPLTVGRAGALAGVIQLPAEARMGTHSLTITGATSGKTATVNFPVKAAPVGVATTTATPAVSSWPHWLPSWPVLLFVGVGLLAFAGAMAWRVRRQRNVHRTAKRAAPADGPAVENGHI